MPASQTAQEIPKKLSSLFCRPWPAVSKIAKTPSHKKELWIMLRPLASLMDVLGVLIEKYEEENVVELTE